MTARVRQSADSRQRTGRGEIRDRQCRRPDEETGHNAVQPWHTVVPACSTQHHVHTILIYLTPQTRLHYTTPRYIGLVWGDGPVISLSRHPLLGVFFFLGHLGRRIGTMTTVDDGYGRTRDSHIISLACGLITLH